MKMISAVSCHVLHVKLFHMSQSRVCKVAECDVVNRNCMRHTHTGMKDLGNVIFILEF